MVPDEEGVLRKVDAIKRELRQHHSAAEIENYLHFVAIEKAHFRLWPIAVVLYDADLATKRGGIICEPMTSEVGHDLIDQVYRDLYVEHVNSGGSLDKFLDRLADFDWIQRRQEKTFDIALDGRVVDKLADSFAEIWNSKILAEVEKKTSEQDQSALRSWLIETGVSE